jgi:hypothetical protein
MGKATRRPAIFRHSSHAEWGHGIVVEENPCKVYLSFENGGRRPFLNDPKYRQLLVPVVLSSEDSDALVARLEKLFGPLTKPAVRKRKAPAKQARPVEKPLPP